MDRTAISGTPKQPTLCQKGMGFVGDLDRAAQRGWEVGAGYRWPLVSSHRRCLVKAKSQLWLINVDYNLRRFLVKLS